MPSYAFNTGSGPILRATNAIMAKCRDSIANGRRLPTFGFADDHLHGLQITTIQQLIAILDVYKTFKEISSLTVSLEKLCF